MPIIEIDQSSLVSARSVSDLPVTRSIPTSQVVTSFLSDENVAHKAAEGLGNLLFRDFQEDAAFDPYENMAGYEGYADSLGDARNRNEMTFLKGKIDDEISRASDFADSTGLQKFIGIGALIATDPTTLIPVGGVAYKTYRTGGKILEGGARVAGAAAAIESGREAILHANSVTRTVDESLVNIGAASLLSGFLGSASAGLSKVQFDDLAKRLDEDLVAPGNNLSSVGAMQVGTTFEQEEIKGLTRAKAALNNVPGFLKNPVFEGATSQSKVVRDVTEKLSDLSLVKNKNSEFIASETSVELRVKAYDTLRVPYHKDAKAAWKSYRARVKKQLSDGGIPVDEQLGSLKGGALSYNEFSEQAGRAARRNDSHVIAEVAAVAQSARKNIFDPVLKRAEEVGVFKDIDALDVKTADTWLKRMYNTEKIIQERTVFKEKVLAYLVRNRAASEELLPVQKQAAGIVDLKNIKTKNTNSVRARINKFDGQIKELDKQIDLLSAQQQKLINKRFDPDFDKLANPKKSAGLEAEGRVFLSLRNRKEGLIKRKRNFSSKIEQQNVNLKSALSKIDELDGKLSRFRDDGLDVDNLEKLVKRNTFKSDQLDAELDEIAEQIIDRITNATNGRLPYDNKLTPQNKGPQKIGARGSAKQRVFNIPDEEIEDFLVSDINAVIDGHIRTMAPDNELLEKFGSLDFDVVKKLIQEDYQGLRAAAKGNNKALAKLDKKLGEDINNMQAMWDKLRGIYAQPDDYSAPQHVFERGAMALNFARLLGDVVASSVPDIMRPVMVHGFNRTYGKLFKSAIADMKGLKMSAAEMDEIGLALDMTNSMTALRRANMDEYTPNTGKIDAASQKVSQGVANLTGINIWNATQRTFAGIMTQNRMLDAIADLSKGKSLARKEIENLAAHGIDRNMAKRIAGEFKEHGETRKTLKIANARNWENANVRNTFRAAIRKQVDEIIVNPGLDRPLWLSRPGWRAVGQFKSFTFSSMQRVTLAGLQQADAHTMQGLVSMVFVGSLVYAYKTKMSGRNVSDDPRVWIAEGIDRSGVSGWGMDVNNIIEKATRGRVGVNALIGGPPMSRYASRNVTGALMGPSFGLAQDLFQATGAMASGEISSSDVHAMRRVVPMQNIPYLRGMFNQIEDGVNSALGAERK